MFTVVFQLKKTEHPDVFATVFYWVSGLLTTRFTAIISTVFRATKLFESCGEPGLVVVVTHPGACWNTSVLAEADV